VFAPAGTPHAIVERLNREIGKALQVPAVREKLAVQGVDPMEMDTAVFGRFVKDEVVSTTELAKALDLKPN
jgi:tripartite-type tricarboxylate transporter receptor subunit TctC